MRFRCAYSKKDAVAAQDSNSCSVFSGVSVGIGWSCLMVFEGFEEEEPDLCLDSCPVDILGHAVFSRSVSQCSALRSWPYIGPCGL